MARARHKASNDPISLEDHRRRRNDTTETVEPARVIDLARQMQFDDIMETIIARVREKARLAQQDAG